MLRSGRSSIARSSRFERSPFVSLGCRVGCRAILRARPPLARGRDEASFLAPFERASHRRFDRRVAQAELPRRPRAVVVVAVEQRPNGLGAHGRVATQGPRTYPGDLAAHRREPVRREPHLAGEPQIRSSRSTASRVVRLAPTAGTAGRASRASRPGCGPSRSLRCRRARSSCRRAMGAVRSRPRAGGAPSRSLAPVPGRRRGSPTPPRGRATPPARRRAVRPGAWSARRRRDTSLGAACPRPTVCRGSPIADEDDV